MNRICSTGPSGDSVGQLRERCQRAKAEGRSKEQAEAHHRRLHERRRCWTFTDDDGAFGLRALFAPEAGARLKAALEAQCDRFFHQARKEGRMEPVDAYRADALLALVTGKGILSPETRKQQTAEAAAARRSPDRRSPDLTRAHRLTRPVRRPTGPTIGPRTPRSPCTCGVTSEPCAGDRSGPVRSARSPGSAPSRSSGPGRSWARRWWTWSSPTGWTSPPSSGSGATSRPRCSPPSPSGTSTAWSRAVGSGWASKRTTAGWTTPRVVSSPTTTSPSSATTITS